MQAHRDISVTHLHLNGIICQINIGENKRPEAPD